MNDIIYVLDAGPLGLVTNPKESPDTRSCAAWLRSVLAGGARVMVPDVVDYEVRRELIRAGKPKGLARLDVMAEDHGEPVDRRVWPLAAEMWAEVRRAGMPTAPDPAIDVDVIVAAFARLAAEDGTNVVVVTDNVGHLIRFVEARNWRELAASESSES